MRTFLSILAVPLLAAACVGPGSGGVPSASPASPGPPAPSASPASPAPSASSRYVVAAGADKPILRLSKYGGFMPPGYLLTMMPTVALYGDGRLIVQGPTIEIYPAPLLPNLRQLHVTPAEIQKIVAAADAAGLLGPDAHYDAINIMDAGTTVFTTTVDGRTHTVSAYALGESGISNDAAVTSGRTKLVDFSTKISDLARFLGRPLSDTQAYAPTEMRVFVGPAPGVDPAFPNPQTAPWPLTVNPKLGHAITNPGITCMVIKGADLTSFLKVATGANALTVWSAPSGRFSVSVRPLYPEEMGCPSTAG